MKKESEDEDLKIEKKLMNMTKKLSRITKLKKNSDPAQNSFPQPKKVKCFQCHTNFYIKFVVPQQNYSQKNNWTYWTGNQGNQQICDHCLLKFYYNKPVYWSTITDLKKRQQIRKYIYEGTIAAK